MIQLNFSYNLITFYDVLSYMSMCKYEKYDKYGFVRIRQNIVKQKILLKINWFYTNFKQKRIRVSYLYKKTFNEKY